MDTNNRQPSTPKDALQSAKQALSQGRFDQAVATVSHALSELEDAKDKVELLYVKAVAKRLSGDNQAAIDINRDLLKIAPNHARVYQELAYLNRNLNRTQQAAESFYKATQLNPALLASWNALLAHYKQSGNTEAEIIAQAQIDYLNALPKQILHARDLMYEGQLHQADQLCRRFLQTNKHQVDGMLLLAEIGIALKVYSDAEFLLESCLELYPDNTAAGIEYLKLLSKMGRFQAAKDIASQLLIKHDNHLGILSAKASAMVGLGEIDAAIDLYHHALSLSGESAGIYLLLGHAYKAAGKLAEAVKAYQQAYDKQSGFGDAFWSLANTKTYAFTDAEIAMMEGYCDAQTRLESVSKDDQIHLHFALGKAHEDRANFDSAFRHYDVGNRLKRHANGYNSEIVTAQVANQKRVFSKRFIDKIIKRSKEACHAPDPIFIVGLPRAGSTLLEQILASHSKIDGTMELHNIMALAARLRGQKNQYPEMLETLAPEYFSRFGQQYIDDTRIYRQNAPYFIDKMPNNFMHIGLIRLILPNAKIIDARREPMACCFSGFKQLFAEGQDFSYSLQDIGQYYLDYVDMMQHWDEVLPEFVLKVKHEDVLDNLEGEIKRMLDFVGLEFESSCLDFHKTKRVIKTPSSEQVRQPIFKSSVDQYRAFEAHLAPLKDTLSPLL
ncbi:tetratricopeptide repeat-containing sulfotransferase family protein [Ningiella sp. W23]|uniref:tetratricopeptide repeat-containing sulfotransferase family protein n=1 Tax=Ningiella sp. W23 TaxID=3023715 RepID=UPI00375806CB